MIQTKKFKAIQIPVNTFVSNNEIYIPLFYSLDILQEALGRQLIFNGPNRLILGRALDPEAESEYTTGEQNSEELRQNENRRKKI